MNEKVTDPTRAARQRFTAETRMGDVLAQDPNARLVLMQFHIGGCSHCGFEQNDTVMKVAADNGVPLDRLLSALNGSR